MTSEVTEIKSSMNEQKRIGEQENKSKVKYANWHKTRQSEVKYRKQDRRHLGL